MQVKKTSPSVALAPELDRIEMGLENVGLTLRNFLRRKNWILPAQMNNGQRVNGIKRAEYMRREFQLKVWNRIQKKARKLLGKTDGRITVTLPVSIEYRGEKYLNIRLPFLVEVYGNDGDERIIEAITFEGEGSDHRTLPYELSSQPLENALIIEGINWN